MRYREYLESHIFPRKEQPARGLYHTAQKNLRTPSSLETLILIDEFCALRNGNAIRGANLELATKNPDYPILTVRGLSSQLAAQGVRRSVGPDNERTVNSINNLLDGHVKLWALYDLVTVEKVHAKLSCIKPTKYLAPLVGAFLNEFSQCCESGIVFDVIIDGEI